MKNFYKKPIFLFLFFLCTPFPCASMPSRQEAIQDRSAVIDCYNSNSINEGSFLSQQNEEKLRDWRALVGENNQHAGQAIRDLPYYNEFCFDNVSQEKTMEIIFNMIGG